MGDLISDLACFKMHWFAKRLDSEVKRKVFGQQAVEADVVESHLDSHLILGQLHDRLWQKTEEALTAGTQWSARFRGPLPDNYGKEKEWQRGEREEARKRRALIKEQMLMQALENEALARARNA